MKMIKTTLPDLLIVEPQCFEDERGFFFESFHQRQFDEALGYPVTFVQDNHSKSVNGVLRGLHYQLPPYGQGKLVRCVVGAVFDVAVDIRKSSPTFGQWFGVEISADNRRQLWIPEGVAHGVFTLSDEAQLLYKTTAYYQPEAERGIIWNDPTLNIDWPLAEGQRPILSEKDRALNPFAKATYY